MIRPALLLLTLVALVCTGCTFTQWTGPAKPGETPPSLTRISIGGNQAAGEVDATKGVLKGYQSEQAEVAGAIAGSVAAGVTKALAKP